MIRTKKLSGGFSAMLADWQTICEKLCLAALIGAVMSLGLWILWTLDRGLELTDEAYYVLNGMHPEAIRFFFTPTQWIASSLWRVTGSLAGFRAIGLLILTGSAAMLAAGAIRSGHWLGLPRLETWGVKALLLGVTTGAAWLYGAVLNFSPSYNSLSAAGAYFSVGLALYGLDCGDRRKSLALFALVGVTLGLTIIAKFSAGICVTALLLGFFVVFRRAPGITARNALALTVAVPLTVIFMAIVFSSPTTAWDAFRNGLALTGLAQQNEPTSVRLMRNWQECRALVGAAVQAFRGPLLCAAVSLLLRRAWLGIVAGLWFVLNLASGDFLLGGMDRYQVQSIPLSATVLLAMLLTIGVWARKQRLALLVVGLFILPFLVSIGTGNALPFQITLSMASWGLLLAALTVASQGQQRLVALLFSLIFVAIAASQIVTSGMRSPYRLSHGLPSQTIAVDIPSIGPIRVDAETSKFLSDMQAAGARCGIRAGAPYLGFYDLAGLAMVLDMVPVDTPWLFGEKFAGAVLDQMDPAIIRSAFVAVKLDENGQRPRLPEQMKVFPQNYRMCGTAVLPFQSMHIELWAPREP